MTRIFYAKVRIFVKEKKAGGHSQTVLQTFGYDAEEAKENVIRMIFNWGNIKDVEIVKISLIPIKMFRFVVVSTLRYVNGQFKTIKFNTFAETPDDAINFFRVVVSDWDRVVGLTIDSVKPHNKR